MWKMLVNARVVNATLKKYPRYRYSTEEQLRQSSLCNRTQYAFSQTSTSSRRSYMKHSLRVKITIIFSSTQLNLSLHYDIFVNPAFTYTYYRPFILFHLSKVTETSMGVDRYEKVGGQNRFPLDREIVLKIAKNSFTVVIVDKGLCNVSVVRFYQEIMNGDDRS